MFTGMILIGIDECGDEFEYARYDLKLDLDNDELEIWKLRKERQAEEAYPEARRFYWEDRRLWNRAMSMMMMNPWLDMDEAIAYATEDYERECELE